MKAHKPLVICVTGKMGSGKSTVTALFNTLYGVPVYDADSRARMLMETPRLKSEIIRLFGPRAYERGVLNRAYLAHRVFGDPAALKRLEQIVHPRVREDLEEWLEAHRNEKMVLVENAILFKSGMYPLCDKVLFVTAPDSVLLKRLKKDRQMTENQIRARWKHQDFDTITSKKNIIFIQNNKSLRELLTKVKELYRNFVDI